MKILLPDYEDCQIYGIIRYIQAGGRLHSIIIHFTSPMLYIQIKVKHLIPTIFTCRLTKILANMKEFASKHQRNAYVHNEQ